MGFPGGSVVKNLPASPRDARDVGLISGLGRSPGVGNGNRFKYSCLENFMERGAWPATVHGGSQKSQSQLSTHAFIYECKAPLGKIMDLHRKVF